MIFKDAWRGSKDEMANVAMREKVLDTEGLMRRIPFVATQHT
jgi:hypothetical protein